MQSQNHNMNFNDTIVALATPSGSGAIAVIRLSGQDAIAICARFFKSIHNKELKKAKNTYHSVGSYSRWQKNDR